MEKECFEYVSVESLSTLILCGTCKEPLWEPRRLSCKHKFCAFCLAHHLRASKTCPVCAVAVNPATDIRDVDETLKDLLSESVTVFCRNRKTGCAWAGVREQLFTHVDRDCAHVPCRHRRAGCNFVASSSDALKHASDACDFAPSQCPDCQTSVPRRDLPAHLEKCPDAIQARAARAAQEERERRAAEERQRREAYAARRESRLALCQHLCSGITICCDGRNFVVSKATLLKEPDSVLALIAQDHTDGAPLSLDIAHFPLIVAWLRTDVVPTSLSIDTYNELLATARLLDLDRLVDALLAQPTAPIVPASLPSTAATVTAITDDSTSFELSRPVGLACQSQLELLNLIARFQCASQRVALVGMDLRGCHLMGIDLSYKGLPCNLNGARLSGVNLTDACLDGADLRGADLTDATLDGVSLVNADLRGATLTRAHCVTTNLTGAKLDHADLSEAQLGSATLTDVSLVGAHIDWAHMPTALAGVNLSGLDLTCADLAERDLSRAVLVGASLEWSRMPRALPAVVLDGHDLSRVDLSSKDMRGASFVKCNLANASLYKTDASQACFDGANLRDANMSKAIVEGASFLASKIDWTRMPRALVRTNLTGQDLSRASLVGRDLSHANLTGCRFYGTDFSRAILTGAILADTTFRKTALADVVHPRALACPWGHGTGTVLKAVADPSAAAKQDSQFVHDARVYAVCPLCLDHDWL